MLLPKCINQNCEYHRGVRFFQHVCFTILQKWSFLDLKLTTLLRVLQGIRPTCIPLAYNHLLILVTTSFVKCHHSPHNYAPIEHLCTICMQPVLDQPGTSPLFRGSAIPIPADNLSRRKCKIPDFLLADQLFSCYATATDRPMREGVKIEAIYCLPEFNRFRALCYVTRRHKRPMR